MVAPGPRRRFESYDQSDELAPLAEGDRLFIRCENGPARSRLETFPPRLELPEEGGMYVLIDIGERASWVYEWVPADGH